MIDLNEKICRLSDVKSNEDIKALSFAKFPGTHCPLFGVAMIASFISDLAVLVVGTGECTYYSKGFAYGNQKGNDNFYSLAIGKNEITFGCGKQILSALKRIENEDKPQAIMVVTTCVLEVIGEDVESLLMENEMDFNAKLLCVKTEHFKCGSHIPGMERALKSLVTVMERGEKAERSINILGHRKHGVEETEVISALQEENIKINSIIPSNCTIADLVNASKTSLNIVTDFTALPLAREMEKCFGIPFVYFGRHLMKEKIDREYKRIEEIFEISLINRLEDKRDKLDQLEEKAKILFKDKSFIYGNTPMMAFEVTDYLTHLGLIPLFVQVREYYEEERGDMDSLLSRSYNPYIAQIANIAPMQEVYDELKPAIYLGHENPMALWKKGIVQITADEVTEKIGYEVPIKFLEKIISIYEMSIAKPDMPVGMLSMMGLSEAPADSPMMKMRQSDGVDEWLDRLEKYSVHSEVKEENTLDKNGLTAEMARAVEKGMPLAIAKMISKRGGKA